MHTALWIFIPIRFCSARPIEAISKRLGFVDIDSLSMQQLLGFIDIDSHSMQQLLWRCYFGASLHRASHITIQQWYCCAQLCLFFIVLFIPTSVVRSARKVKLANLAPLLESGVFSHCDKSIRRIEALTCGRCFARKRGAAGTLRRSWKVWHPPERYAAYCFGIMYT